MKMGGRLKKVLERIFGGSRTLGETSVHLDEWRGRQKPAASVRKKHWGRPDSVQGEKKQRNLHVKRAVKDETAAQGRENNKAIQTHCGKRFRGLGPAQIRFLEGRKDRAEESHRREELGL